MKKPVVHQEAPEDDAAMEKDYDWVIDFSAKSSCMPICREFYADRRKEGTKAESRKNFLARSSGKRILGVKISTRN